jgi:hypothetical protein
MPQKRDQESETHQEFADQLYIQTGHPIYYPVSFLSHSSHTLVWNMGVEDAREINRYQPENEANAESQR